MLLQTSKVQQLHKEIPKKYMQTQDFLEASYIKAGLHSCLAQSRLKTQNGKKKNGNKIECKETAAAWTQCTQECVCWDLALASPRPPTLWLKQIPSSEPPPSLYLYLAVSTRRHETHYIKHRASLRKDQLVARSFSGRSASLSPTNYFNEYKTMS